MALVARVALRVNFLGGEEHDLEVEDEATVEETKQQLEMLLQIPIKEQRLVLNGNVLDNSSRPFKDADADGPVELLLVRAPAKSLEEFLNESLLSCSSADLPRALALASAHDEASVCEEIVSHENFQPHQGMLRDLVRGGLYNAFIYFFDHPGLPPMDDFTGALQDGLRVAARRGLALHCDELLKRLPAPLAGGISPEGCSALHHAANAEVTRLLLADESFSTGDAINAVDKYGCTCLHYASIEASARQILSHPNFTQVNTADQSLQTALHCARNVQVCSAILDHPDFNSLNARDNKGRTALHTCARSEAVACLLLSQGIDANVVDQLGRTALHYARSPGLARALLDAGVEAGLADKEGQTALHCCVNAAVAELLLSQPGFPVNARDSQGKTALSIAAQLSRSDVVLDILAAKGVEVDLCDCGAGLTEEARSALEAAARKAAGAAAPEAPADSPDQEHSKTRSLFCSVI